jgi:hypothetical protein
MAPFMTPVTGGPKSAPQSLRRPPPIIEWKGRLPEPLAQFIERLSAFDLPETYAVTGRFLEVRELVNIARRLHQVLERGPHTAASGRWSFEEFMATKTEIERQIRLLHHRVNRAADDARLAFPPPLDSKEENHALRADARVA